jgi:hypothetical protein
MYCTWESNYDMLDSVSVGKCHRDYINALALIEGNLAPEKRTYPAEKAESFRLFIFFF